MNTTKTQEPDIRTGVCPVETAINAVGGKWKLLIINLIYLQSHRFGELKKKLPHISERMLTRQLRGLERDGIIARKEYPEVPPRVEYTLTESGAKLVPALEILGEWGRGQEAARRVVKHDVTASRVQGR